MSYGWEVEYILEFESVIAVGHPAMSQLCYYAGSLIMKRKLSHKSCES